MSSRAAKPVCVAVCDTREPPDCAWRLGIPTVRAKLESGDYSFRGGESSVAIERKTLSDWIGSLTFGRARFEREMDRLSTFSRAVIVVEANLDEVLGGDYRSAVTPKALRGSIASIQARWGVSTQFIGDRAKAEEFATTWLVKCWKHGALWRPKFSRFRRRAAA